MKVLAPATGEQGLALVEALGSAAREFNRTLDIRLRFLDIGIDLIVVRPLRGQPGAGSDAWTGRIEGVLVRECPRLLVVSAADPVAIPAACAAGERGVRVVVLVSEDGREAAQAVRERCPEVRFHDISDPAAPEEGRRLIEILVAERAGS